MSTINAVGVGLSGSTGTGAFVGSISPIMVTPTLGAASATSIDFGQTALDYYSESVNWTPVFSFATAGDLSVSYTTQEGVYSRIGGGLVFAGWSLVCTPTFTTASGNFLITGLPFSSASSAPVNFGSNLSQQSAGVTYPAGTTFITPVVNTNATTIYYAGMGSAVNSANLTTLSFVSGVAVSLTGGIIYAI